MFFKTLYNDHVDFFLKENEIPVFNFSSSNFEYKNCLFFLDFPESASSDELEIVSEAIKTKNLIPVLKLDGTKNMNQMNTFVGYNQKNTYDTCLKIILFLNKKNIKPVIFCTLHEYNVFFVDFFLILLSDIEIDSLLFHFILEEDKKKEFLLEKFKSSGFVCTEV